MIVVAMMLKHMGDPIAREMDALPLHGGEPCGSAMEHIAMLPRTFGYRMTGSVSVWSYGGVTVTVHLIRRRWSGREQR